MGIREQAKAQTVRKIVDAARRLFGSQGFQGASMGSVAKAAGVSKGLLHYHFDSKEHLLLTTTRATFTRIHRDFADRFDAFDDADTATNVRTAVDALDALYQTLRDLQPLTPFMVQTLAMSTKEDEIRQDLLAFFDEHMALLEDGIAKLFATLPTDELLPSLPPRRLARLVKIQMSGLVIELSLASGEAQLAEVDQDYQSLRQLFQHLIHPQLVMQNNDQRGAMR